MGSRGLLQRRGPKNMVSQILRRDGFVRAAAVWDACGESGDHAFGLVVYDSTCMFSVLRYIFV